MPIYEYRCKKCDAVNEQLLRKATDGPGNCPSCGHGELERVMSAFNALSSGDRPRCDNPDPYCGADPSCCAGCPKR